jgi:hypothetical protein
MSKNNALDMHHYQKEYRDESDKYEKMFKEYKEKYTLVR